MATYGQITKGTRARKVIKLPLGRPSVPQLSGDGRVLLSEPESSIAVGLRPLTHGELTDVFTQARADALARGVTDPRSDNPIYEMAEMEHTLVLACVDPDIPEGRPPVPFFSGVEEIRNAPDLGRERVAYLFAQWKLWQLEMSPSLRKVTPEEFVAGLHLIGGEDEEGARDFFASLGPGLQWSYMRSLASRWLASPTPRSTST